MAEDHLNVVAHGVGVRRLVTPAIQIVRLRGHDDALLSGLCQALDIVLPRTTNHAAGEAPRALVLAPGEWMLVSRPLDRGAFHNAARGTRVAHLADVGAGLVVYAVEGRRARDLIAKGCPLDLHPRVFGEGRCAQSSLAQIFVIIDRVPGQDVFHVYADASYARHLDLWFEDAAIEFRSQDVD
ncbi:sarcosine oxidase subunit gamma [Sphingomonas sp. Leaf357]|uniref:sarcosine oxidase subunit gamma n=1 Tax=Sphingomonas sp. Leaf357 TaxID=1736350 RepID=UPI000AE51BD1|nr:sarcosine oxidase subunit gamma family protein [Sphingomonas sp. Leaf357]